MNEQIRQVILERVRWQFSKAVTYDSIRNARINVEDFGDLVGEMMVVEATMSLPGLADEMIVIHESYPQDWWQAVKERWFPQWLLNRFPVKYKEINIEEKRFKSVCPHAWLPEDQDKHTIHWLNWCDENEV